MTAPARREGEALSLRDEIALRCVVSMCAGYLWPEIPWSTEGIVHDAYALADEFISQRDEREESPRG